MLKTVVIIGPESTGKSTLCQQLAAHYNTRWCEEYAREYLLKNGVEYTYADLLTIARGQLALEETYIRELSEKMPESSHNAVAANEAGENAALRYLFVDTNQYVMKVWCEFVFNDCHTWILNRIAERKYDLYLLCNTDLPWVKDELREYPNEGPRQVLYKIYEDLLVHQTVKWAVISGSYDERLQQAVAAIDAAFQH